MIHVISKSTFGSYNVRDIQCNANWDCCPYSDYATIPEPLVDGILATQGYCDITLNSEGTEVVSFAAREIPSVSEECCGDNTVLSVNGVKANTDGDVTLDAGVVGAAPAGYGLGTGGVYNSAVNNIFNGGFYRWDTANANTPFANGVMIVVPRDKDKRATQLAFSNSGTTEGVMAVRSTKDASVGEWEYINPPMVPDIEYRTTERYNNKVVYTKIVSFGTMPAGNISMVQHGAEVKQIVRCTGMNITLGADISCLINEAYNTPVAYCSANKTHVCISANIDCSAYEAQIQIWYTKD